MGEGGAEGAMKLFVSARPGSRKESVEQVDETHFKVSVRENPENGEANMAIAAALARHLGIPRSRMRLRSGAKGRKKVFEVED